VRFSEMATELGDAFDAVEANPVIASPGGVVAVDALVIARAIAPMSSHGWSGALSAGSVVVE
jgi:hypothetical protein